jgi:hypothetical protein
MVLSACSPYFKSLLEVLYVEISYYSSVSHWFDIHNFFTISNHFDNLVWFLKIFWKVIGQENTWTQKEWSNWAVQDIT